jgi:hypothetical protein
VASPWPQGSSSELTYMSFASRHNLDLSYLATQGPHVISSHAGPACQRFTSSLRDSAFILQRHLGCSGDRRGSEVEPGGLARWGSAVVAPPWHRWGRRSALDSGHGGRQRHGWGGGAPQRPAARAEAWRMAARVEAGDRRPGGAPQPH